MTFFSEFTSVPVRLVPDCERIMLPIKAVSVVVPSVPMPWPDCATLAVLETLPFPAVDMAVIVQSPVKSATAPLPVLELPMPERLVLQATLNSVTTKIPAITIRFNLVFILFSIFALYRLPANLYSIFLSLCVLDSTGVANRGPAEAHAS